MPIGLLDFLPLCGAAGSTLDDAHQGGLLAGLFVAGLAGSAFHCAPMCGALVLGQVSDRMARLPMAQLCEWRRVRLGALVPYHLGRMTTYAGLGALAGLSAGVLSQAAWLRGLSSGLLTLAAVAMLLQLCGYGIGGGAAWSRPLARAARALGGGGFGLGLVLGLLPCGLIYGALLAASASGSALTGAAAMAAFALGTMPALMVVGIAGQAVGHRWRRAMRTVSPALTLFSVLLLLGLAWIRGFGVS